MSACNILNGWWKCMYDSYLKLNWLYLVINLK